jgi:16S rRNA (guanine527-N7)-methyltransferase
VSLHDIAEVLADRAAHAGIVVSDVLAAQLTVYYQLLSHWNQKINLTSLSDPDEAVDRLLLEPVAAALQLPAATSLIDLGSGGGSPAIPLAMALGVSRLVMVESRTRKAAFLREAVRELALPGTVESERFEAVAQQEKYHERFDLVSVRAVRIDGVMLASVAAFLQHGGRAALFRAPDAEDPPAGLPAALHWAGTTALVPSSRSAMTVLTRQ